MGEWRGCACGEGFYRERLQPRMTGERLAGYLNALSDERARAALQSCCGARRWVDAMLAARPFASDAELLATAERVWWELGRPDWLEAFAAHPRIGGRVGAGMDWARREQAGAADAAAATLAARSEEHTSELQSRLHLVCRLLLEKKKKKIKHSHISVYAIIATLITHTRRHCC